MKLRFRLRGDSRPRLSIERSSSAFFVESTLPGGAGPTAPSTTLRAGCGGCPGCPHIFQRLLLITLVITLPLVCLAAKEFSMPKVQPAFSYPAHDHHGNEDVTVAVDPYETAAKAGIFTAHYGENELLPVMVVITNDSEQPVQLTDMNAELVTADRTKLSPLSEDDIFRRLSHPNASGTRYPVPFPTKKAKGGVDSKTRDEVQGALFRAKAVEPRSSQSGFMFFDISDLSSPLRGANFYLTGVRDSSGHDLMYFEISVDKYLDAAKQH